MRGRRSRGAGRAAVLGAAALALGLGCGGEEGDPSGAPMGARETPAERGSNAAPVVERVAISPRDPRPGTTVEAVVEARDPDGDPVELQYTWRLNGEVVRKGRRSRFAPEDARPEDRLEVEVVASDGVLESEPRRARERVANRPPKIRSVRLDAGEGLRPGDVVTALVDARDPDGHRLRFDYEWLVNGEPVDADEKSFTTSGLERGDAVSVRVVARDGRDASRPEESAEVRLGNSAPRFTGVPEPTREDGVFRWHFEAEDPDGDRGLRFRLAEAPDGMTVDPILGVVRWRPTVEQAGTHAVEIRVEDEAGATSGLRFEATVSAEVAGREEAGGEAREAPPASPAS